MATNLDLDPALVDEAVRVGGRATKKDAVTEALREYIARRRQAHVTRLFGSVEYRAKSCAVCQARAALAQTDRRAIVAFDSAAPRYQRMH